MPSQATDAVATHSVRYDTPFSEDKANTLLYALSQKLTEAKVSVTSCVRVERRECVGVEGLDVRVGARGGEYARHALTNDDGVGVDPCRPRRER